MDVVEQGRELAGDPARAPDPGVAGEPFARPEPPLTWRDVADRALALDRAALARRAVLVVLALLGASAAWFVAVREPAPPPIEDVLPRAGSAAAASGTGTSLGASPGGTSGDADMATTTTEPAVLVVHAAGAVVAPGVHAVPAGSRVADVLAAAGGPAPDADVDAVNLAALVADGERLWFPRRGEVVPAGAVPAGTGTAGSGGAAGSAGGATPSQPLDLNAASATELESLPGIGPALAAAIVEQRTRNGPFTDVEDLLDVPGIGESKLAQLRELVTT